MTSSREIQWCCEADIIFKALSCDIVLHFTICMNITSGMRPKLKPGWIDISGECYEGPRSILKTWQLH